MVGGVAGYCGFRVCRLEGMPWCFEVGLVTLFSFDRVPILARPVWIIC